MQVRRTLIIAIALGVFACATATATAAELVGGTVSPAVLHGKPTVVMFLHPF